MIYSVISKFVDKKVDMTDPLIGLSLKIKYVDNFITDIQKR